MVVLFEGVAPPARLPLGYLACSGPKKGDKIRNRYFTRAFSGAQKWAK